MSNYDDTLHRLQQDTRRKHELEDRIRELEGRLQTLAARTGQLTQQAEEEQQDVDRLEQGGLTSLLYSALGRREEKLEQEREEADTARQRLYAAQAEQAAAERELRRAAEELRRLDGCEEAYRRALDAKAGALETTPAGRELADRRERLTRTERQLREIREALNAGAAVQSTLETLSRQLNSASELGTWDMFGGGLVATVMKHNELGEVQETIRLLQTQLSGLRTELADIAMAADIQVDIDDFLQFADYFFDGFYVDLMVQEQIDRARLRANESREAVAAALIELESRQNALYQEAEEQRQALEAWIAEAPLKQ